MSGDNSFSDVVEGDLVCSTRKRKQTEQPSFTVNVISRSLSSEEGVRMSNNKDRMRLTITSGTAGFSTSIQIMCAAQALRFASLQLQDQTFHFPLV